MPQRIKTVSTTRTRVRRNGSSTPGSPYIQCNMCHGTGVVKNGHKHK